MRILNSGNRLKSLKVEVLDASGQVWFECCSIVDRPAAPGSPFNAIGLIGNCLTVA
jgi:hypothetical protein